MIMLFGVLPLYVLCHVLTCIGQETINYLILLLFPNVSVKVLIPIKVRVDPAIYVRLINTPRPQSR